MRSPEPATVLRALVEDGCLRPADLHDPRLTLRRASGRNAVLLVQPVGRPGLAVKWATDAQQRTALRREAMAYEALSESGISSWCEPVLGTERGGLWLAVRLRRPAVNGVATLFEAPALQRRFSAALGRCLAELHAVPPRVPGVLRRVPGELGWLLRGELANPAVRPQTSAVQEVRRHLHAHDFGRLMARTHEAYRAGGPKRLQHGDLRLENVLTSTASPARITLIDYEYAHLGSPAFDVGSVMAAQLFAMLRGAPFSAARSTAEALALSRHSLRQATRNTRTFFAAYVARARTPRPLARDLWWSALPLAGARLVQHVVEAAAEQSRPTLTLGRALELASALLGAPESAARALGWSVE